jgi:hypothetical protein
MYIYIIYIYVYIYKYIIGPARACLAFSVLSCPLEQRGGDVASGHGGQGVSHVARPDAAL